MIGDASKTRGASKSRGVSKIHKRNPLGIIACLAVAALVSSATGASAEPPDLQQAISNLKAGRYAIALFELEQCKGADPENPQIHYYLGLCNQALNKQERARAEYQFALDHGDAQLQALTRSAMAKQMTAGLGNLVAASQNDQQRPSVRTTNAPQAQVKRVLEFSALW